MSNAFAHVELTTDDVNGSKKFYSKVFAWKLNDVPGMPYTMIDVGGGTGGGMQVRPMPEAPTGWMPYVQVDNVKATVAKAIKAGGKAILPYREIGEMGAIGVIADPHGSFIGVWAPGKQAATETAKQASSAVRKKSLPKAKGKTQVASKKSSGTAKQLAKKPAAVTNKKAGKKAPAAKKPPAKKK